MSAFSFATIWSGIDAPAVAWGSLGWKQRFSSEVEAFPNAVLAHHYPDVPNLGDFTQIENAHGPIDLLCGGTPCQDFSVAGLRAGLDGKRGQLTIEFARLAERLRTRWLLWENVPGVLSCDGGRAFGMFLGLLGNIGYGFAYRILDAQFFGVPQRRRRVFLVGYLGDWRRAAAVLFERHSLSGHPAPRREARQGIARGVEVGPSGGRFTDINPTLDARCKDGFIRNQLGGGGVLTGGTFDEMAAPALSASGRGVARCGESRGQDPLVTHALRADGFDASEDGTGRGTPLIATGGAAHCLASHYAKGGDPSTDNYVVTGGFFDVAPCLTQNYGKQPDNSDTNAGPMILPIAFSAKDHGADALEDCSPTLRAGGHTSSHANAGVMPAVTIGSFKPNQGSASRSLGYSEHVSPTLESAAGGNNKPALLHGMAVRRLTPRECERLQGFPDDYTLIPYRRKPAADGPRYKSLGNSMAVPVMRWIGERIEAVEGIS